ncbi:MAG: histidine phosphatase family protein [candidate division Zixibacteria bacterium]|nr:histidine phosphatase family protein [candidate division Zixibacteria bacterium]
MRITLIRHARAAERDAGRYPDDGLRPLIEKGRREQAALADAMRRMGLAFDVLASSPLTRAVETAEIVAKGIGWGGNIDITPVWGSGFTVAGAIEWLRRFPKDAHVACVGHEPDMSEFSSALLTCDESLNIDFRKSAMIGIECTGRVERGQGVLLYYLPPKLILSLMA